MNTFPLKELRKWLTQKMILSEESKCTDISFHTSLVRRRLLYLSCVLPNLRTYCVSSECLRLPSDIKILIDISRRQTYGEKLCRKERMNPGSQTTRPVSWNYLVPKDVIMTREREREREREEKEEESSVFFHCIPSYSRPPTTLLH